MMSDDTENLLTSLQNHVSMMDGHQKRRHGGKLLVCALAFIRQSWQGELHKVQVRQGLARVLVVVLFDTSRWFQITPLPDDLFEVVVKKENQHFIDAWLVSMQHPGGEE